MLPDLQVLEASLPLATMLLPYRPISHLKEDQALQLAQLAPGLQVIQFDNAMANRRTGSEQLDFVIRLGQAFKSLQLVSFEDDHQETYWGRWRNNNWTRRASVPLDLWRKM
ncbi:hypothetical protein OPQ81_009722 [Rhizoctonia solani]|nr:hypothetical protein OPQ81_009722 [Rhizoctonia solani]